MNQAETQFMSWLAAAQPRFFNAVVRSLPNRPQGMHGLGDGSGSSFLDDLTGALNSISSTVSTVASDKALISYNLDRAKQGLSPVTALPPNYVPPTGMMGSMFSSPIALAGVVVVIGGALWLLFGGRKKKKSHG